MISYEQAKKYLENVLQLPADWETTLQKDTLEFLGLYMRHHATRIPFQNVTLAAVEKSKRVRPTEEDVIAQGLTTGIGGCCINLNFFAKIVLVAIGLDAFAIQGTHNCAPVDGTHCMVLVRLKDGSLYMVELGGAFPILEPVPMQNLPFKILCAGGFPYEFRQMSDTLVGRYNIGGGLLGQYVGKSEDLRTSWDLFPRKFSEFDYPMLETFTNPLNSALLRNPMMCRYFFPEEVQNLLEGELAFAKSNGITHEIPPLTAESDIFIFVWKYLIIIGDKHARRLVKKYTSYTDMAPDLIKFFPMLDPQEVLKACEAWSEFEVVVTAYDSIL